VSGTGEHPSTPAPAIARRKLLITERLQVFQFDVKLPSFRQAMDWPKWETLWASGTQNLRPRNAAQGLHWKHLSKQKKRRMRKPKGVATE